MVVTKGHRLWRDDGDSVASPASDEFVEAQEEEGFKRRDVFVSNILSDYRIGNKQGTQEKYAGMEWTPPTIVRQPSPDEVAHAHKRHLRGEALARSDFPEAIAVFDPRRFGRIGDLFTAGPFYAVKGKLAEVLARFDLGKGGLLPLPVYQADKTTLIEGDYFLLNFGDPKDTFLPEESRGFKPLMKDKRNGFQIWAERIGIKDGDIALSAAALEGTDLWFEKAVHRKFFLSGDLVEALRVAGVKTDFMLNTCRIIARAGDADRGSRDA